METVHVVRDVDTEEDYHGLPENPVRP